jgi:hypothetical protein
MEANPPKTGKFALNYGLILGAISIAFSLILFSSDLHYQQDWKVSIINVVIMIAVLVTGIYQFRKANDGWLTLGQALKVGVGIALVGAIVGLVYQLIFINFIEPDFMTKMMELRKAEMISQNPDMTQEQIDGAVEMMESFSGPGVMVAFALVGSLFFGFVISLIGGLVLKKAKPDY